jgi:NAD(P)-dependent dehydrogenase (short-subunit alcohol dehydrogenase family)
VSENKALSERVVIVTGGGRGIGSGISEVLAGAGAHVAIIYPAASEEVHAKKMIEKIEKAGGKASSYLCDIGYREQIESTVAKIHKDLGRIDGLVNNAGICNFASFFEITPENWQRHLDVNLSGPFFLSQAVARFMKEKGKGAIVNISTVSAFRGGNKQVHYISSKGGLNGLTTSMAHEVKGLGIRVNAILCGGVATDININQRAEQEARDGKPYVDPPGVRGRGIPTDLGNAALFLLSDASEWVTGSLVAVDGGALIS